MHFARFVQFAAALVLTLGFAASAHAQNNLPIRTGNYYIDQAATTASGSSLILTFAQTPTDKFLNITNISCAAIIKSPQIVQGWFLAVGTTLGANDLGRLYAIQGSVPPPEVASDGSKIYSAIINGMLFKLGPGRYPSIIVNAPSNGNNNPNINADCVITGNLTDN